MTPSDFYALISGQRRGLRASVLRSLLRLAEIPYAFAVRWRNRRYDRGRATIHRVAAPVIAVGNLTLGGVGKTPLVEWLGRWFRQRSVRVVLISRGYGAKAGAPNDEALELEQKLPGVPHLQNPDRAAAARQAVDKLGAELILLDDAFQHRRLHRDLDIVLLDALAPFGYGHVFPRGALREPVEGLARAHFVALSRADLVSLDEIAQIRTAVQWLAPSAVWLELAHLPRSLIRGGDPNAIVEEAAIDSLAEFPVAAFCGIGNPAGFRRTLERCGYRVAAWREFPDHHRYTSKDIAALSDWASGSNVEAVLCTQKDLVKLQVSQLGSCPLWALSIGLDVLAGRESLEAALAKLLSDRGGS